MSIIIRGEGAVEQADELADAFTFGQTEASPEVPEDNALWHVAKCRACGKEWEIRSHTLGALAFKRGDREALLAHSRAHDVKPTLRRRK